MEFARFSVIYKDPIVICPIVIVVCMSIYTHRNVCKTQKSVNVQFVNKNNRANNRKTSKLLNIHSHEAKKGRKKMYLCVCVVSIGERKGNYAL